MMDMRQRVFDSVEVALVRFFEKVKLCMIVYGIVAEKCKMLFIFLSISHHPAACLQLSELAPNLRRPHYGLEVGNPSQSEPSRKLSAKQAAGLGRVGRSP